MTGQDWMEKDYYATLGVAKDADAATIKKAYRKLAKQYHPDRNPGDTKAEEKFKDIGEAYAVLSDDDERKKYDAIRAMASGGPRFTAGSGGNAGSTAGFEDLFGSMFGGGANFDPKSAESIDDLLRMFGGGAGGGRRRSAGFNAGGFGGFGGGGPRARRGSDLTASTRLPFRAAAQGAEVQLTVGGKNMKVRVPAGVHDGQKIRLRGKGEPGVGGGPAGDLVITVHVEAHPVFTMSGNDVKLTVPVTFAEAALGATVEVPTLNDGPVKMKIPAGTPSGRTLRLKGRGLKTTKGSGDMLVTIEVAVPQKLSSEARAAVEAFRDATSTVDPRVGLMEQARK